MQKISLRKKLIRLFISTSILPIIILGVVSFFNITHALRENMEIMSKNNLQQTDNNLNIWLESYEDLLYQIYTDDAMATWVDNLDSGKDEAVTINQMRRFLSALLNTKEYIRAISIISPQGVVVTYEQMTPATYKSSWMDSFSLSKDKIYSDVIKDYSTHIYSTEYGTKFANKDYYLFHIAHRIIDYKKLDKECGIAIISIDEDFLQKVCRNSGEDTRTFNFIVDSNGRVISFGEDTGKIGTSITDMNSGEGQRIADYTSYYGKEKDHPMPDFTIYTYHDEDLGWDIVNATDMGNYVRAIRSQLAIILILGMAIVGIAIFVSLGMSKDIVSSVNDIVWGMEQAQEGDLGVRVKKDANMPLEIERIADGFNEMLAELNDAIRSQQEAQIVAMEAQINPHFLYNTLDTINWMAIDKDEYDISNAISSLATILRYAIVNSNAEVTIKDEIEWLKKYIYLQQYRLKNSFTCTFNVDQELQTAAIHKLLLQPFIENAIIHGFDKNQGDAKLELSIYRDDDIIIVIADNGSGMENKMISDINSGIYAEQGTESGIGMKNAATRLKMYYGNKGKLRVERNNPAGTRVIISIPYIQNTV